MWDLGGSLLGVGETCKKEKTLAYPPAGISPGDSDAH